MIESRTDSDVAYKPHHRVAPTFNVDVRRPYFPKEGNEMKHSKLL